MRTFLRKLCKGAIPAQLNFITFHQECRTTFLKIKWTYYLKINVSVLFFSVIKFLELTFYTKLTFSFSKSKNISELFYFHQFKGCLCRRKVPHPKRGKYFEFQCLYGIHAVRQKCNHHKH